MKALKELTKKRDSIPVSECYVTTQDGISLARKELRALAVIDKKNVNVWFFKAWLNNPFTVDVSELPLTDKEVKLLTEVLDNRKRRKLKYAIRVKKDGKAVGWVKGINFDLLTNKEELVLNRFRELSMSFASKKEALDFVQSSPDLQRDREYCFEIVGKTAA